MKGLVSILVVLIALGVSAQRQAQFYGTQEAGLSNLGVVHEGAWSSRLNPGLLPFSNSFSEFSVARPYSLSDLNYYGLNVNYQLYEKQGLGGYFLQGGSEAYSDLQFGLGYGLKLNKQVALGVSANYLGIQQIAQYGSSFALAMDVGIYAELSDRFSIGANAFNVNRARYSALFEQEIPSVLSAGLKYKSSDKVSVMAQVEKELNQKILARVGIEYRIREHLIMRTGVESGAPSFSFGFGYGIKNFQLDFASRFHQTLGLYPQIGLRYQWKERE
jgi:hypothetical protein